MKKNLLLLCFLMLSPLLWAQNGLKTENVFLITLDGMRWQELYGGADEKLIHSKKYTPAQQQTHSKYWHDDPLERRKMLMPFFWSTLAHEGRLMGNRCWGNKVNLTTDYWYSYPGYNEMLSGYADPHIKNNRRINNPNISVLEFVHQQPQFKDRVAVFASWGVFHYIYNTQRSGIRVNAGYQPEGAAASSSGLSKKERLMHKLLKEMPRKWAEVRADVFTHEYALEYLKKKSPRLLHIAYGQTDDHAHDGRYDLYLEAAHQTDAYIRDLWEFVQSDERYRDKTTFIIATDHGRGSRSKKAWRRHGRRKPGADEVWLAIIGPDTPAVGELKTEGQYYQHQLASTIAYFLGLKFEPGTGLAEQPATSIP